LPHSVEVCIDGVRQVEPLQQPVAQLVELQTHAPPTHS
jgi:hypothetical protein